MPSYESPALYIDFARLPPPKVIEDIDYEALVTIYKEQVLSKNPDLARALNLEQSPTNIILEAEAYGEMIVRARVNAAARAVMLPFATGSDLDVLAAFYNVARLPLVNPARDFITHPEDWESDERFRRRTQDSVESFTTAGSAGAYIFHGKSADVTIRDVSAMMTKPGEVLVTVMNSGNDPVPTTAQLDAVRARLMMPNIKPLTTVIRVVPVTKISVNLKATVTLYPGPDAGLVMNDIQNALTKLRDRIGLLGRDLTRSSLFASLTQEGVLDVDLISPVADIAVDFDKCVWIESAEININTVRRE